MQEIISIASGDSFYLMACVDRLVELRELVEVRPEEGPYAGQFRIFMKTLKG